MNGFVSHDPLKPMASSIKTEPISVRDFLRNFASVTKQQGFKRYVIMKHGKPIGVFTPWEAQKKLMDNKAWSMLDDAS